MSRRSTVVYLAVGMLVAGVCASPAFTQSQSQETALLTEVRLLRQAIEALAGNGSRIQLAFGRLQLQEQRTTAAVRRLEDARRALAHHEGALDAAIDRIKDLESALSDASRSPEEVQGIREALAHHKAEVGRMQAERVRLTAEESEAAQTLSHEQGRWSDVNRQVEELERLLTRR